MSGLYNMLMGRNPAFPLIMGAIGIGQENADQFGRVRDCWISEDAKTIGVLHRNYGANGLLANGKAATLPLFREHQECSDGTYAVWLFDVPKGDAADAALKKIAEMTDNTSCWERYMTAIEDLQDGKKNPQTDKMLEVGKKIMGQLSGSIEDGKSRSVDTEDGGIDIISGGDL